MTKQHKCVTSSGLGLFEMKPVSKPSNFIIQQKEKLQKELEELLGTDGVFLYPSHPRVAPKHHHPLFRPFDFAYTGQSGRNTWFDPSLPGGHSTASCLVSQPPVTSSVHILSPGIINILGLPVTQCPLGLNEEGLPLGVQVGAGKLQDHLTLEVALYLEKTFGGWTRPGAK